MLKRKWINNDDRELSKQLIKPKKCVPELLQDLNNGSSDEHLNINTSLANLREKFDCLDTKLDTENERNCCDECFASSKFLKKKNYL